MIYIRIDDRLIHGQIVTAWCQTLGINSILAVDDALAQNEMMKSIVTMGIPKIYHPQIVTTEEALKFWEKEETTGNTLFITRFARNLKPFLDFLSKSKGINIGNCAKQKQEKYAFRGHGVGNFLSFTKEDFAVLEQATEGGCRVIFQQMPKDKEVDWKTIKMQMEVCQ